MPPINSKNRDIAIINDEKTGELLAKAAIINYDKARQIITIDSRYFISDESPRVTMLILLAESIIECQGVVRKFDSLGYREIAVFNTKEKESRTSVRYALQADAVIENILIAGGTSPLAESFPVTLRNISSSGALLSTSRTDLDIGTTFQLKLKIGGNDVVIHTSVVRIVSSKDGVMELGCSFSFIVD